MLPWAVIDRTHSRQFLPKSSSLRTLRLCVEFSDSLRPTSVVPTTYALPLATAAPQPFYFQAIPHSLQKNGGRGHLSDPQVLAVFLEIQPGQSGQLSPLHGTPVTSHQSRVTNLGLG